MTKEKQQSPKTKEHKKGASPKAPPKKANQDKGKAGEPFNPFNKTFEALGIKSKDKPSMGTVFITSGTSAVGYRVASALLDAGHKNVRIGIWKGARQADVAEDVGQRVALELENRGATIIKFDWTDHVLYEMSLAGVNTVFCTLPAMEASVDTFSKFVDACHTAKVKHFVKTSFYSVLDRDVTYEGMVPYATFQHACDKELQKPVSSNLGLPPMHEGMTYTILRTSHLMSTPLIYQGPVIRDEDKYKTASYSMGVNYVSPNDVARAAVVALADSKTHKNKTYDLTGAAPITDAKVCKLLGDFYGTTDTMHMPLGYHEMVDALKKRHTTNEWRIDNLAEMERIKASGVEEKKVAYTKDLVKFLNGSKQETFQDYLANTDVMTYQEHPDKGSTKEKKEKPVEAKVAELAADTEIEVAKEVSAQ